MEWQNLILQAKSSDKNTFFYYAKPFRSRSAYHEVIFVKRKHVWLHVWSGEVWENDDYGSTAADRTVSTKTESCRPENKKALFQADRAEKLLGQASHYSQAHCTCTTWASTAPTPATNCFSRNHCGPHPRTIVHHLPQNNQFQCGQKWSNMHHQTLCRSAAILHIFSLSVLMNTRSNLTN